MGARGPAPKSKVLKLLAGTYRADRAKPKDVQLPNLDAEPPKGLTGAAKQEWVRVVALAPPGFLSGADRTILAQYCETMVSVGKLTRKLWKLGYTFKAPSGYVCQRPEVGILSKQNQLLVQLCAQLGFTPTSRHRVEVKTPAEPAVDPNEELLFGRRPGA